MAEDTVEVSNKPKRGLSRRGFLGLMGIGGVIALLQTKTGKEVSSILMGPDVGIISEEIPPGLAGREIPTKNEFYRQPVAILAEGIMLYETWKEANGSLPEVIYVKPPNYLDVSRGMNLVEKAKHKLDPVSELMELADELSANDQPGHAFVNFSIIDINGFEQVMAADPGTGVIRQAKERYLKEFGSELNLSTDEQKEYLATSCQKWFEKARAYVDTQVKKQRKQSTSLLFAYFLHKNEGNLSESMWDTDLWLKVAARCNRNTWERELTRSGAESLTDLFKDEFSLKVSANWVLDNVPPSDTLLNSAERDSSIQFKDFMPINRAGGFYHAWGIIALSTSMSPFVLRRFIVVHHSYIGENYYDGKNVMAIDGREKVVADLTLSTYADELGKLVESYK